jgi:hypothetical protein
VKQLYVSKQLFDQNVVLPTCSATENLLNKVKLTAIIMIYVRSDYGTHAIYLTD